MDQEDERLKHDKKLFIRISRSDEAAFTEVFHHYNPQLYPFVLKMLKSETMASEVIQIIFIRLWKKRSLLQQVKNPRSYIFTMAVNSTRDHLKKIARESRMFADLKTQGTTSLSNETEEWIFLKEKERLLAKVVEKLPPQRQKIFKLSREENKSYKEIAQELGISVNTVKSHLVEALRFIRKKLY